MDDLISRQAAIDELNVSAELLKRALDDTDLVGAEREKFEWGLGLIESCISDMKDLPSAQPEPRWIPVNERLPEDERYVLVTTVSGDVTEAKYWQKERFWVLKGLAIMSVTAWMPRPKPYERSDNG